MTKPKIIIEHLLTFSDGSEWMVWKKMRPNVLSGGINHQSCHIKTNIYSLRFRGVLVVTSYQEDYYSCPIKTEEGIYTHNLETRPSGLFVGMGRATTGPMEAAVRINTTA